jgi:hypothetical protein
MTDIVESLRDEMHSSGYYATMYDAAEEIEQLRAHNEVLRTALSSIMEYEPVREDFGPLPKHDKQFQTAQEIFKVARAALNGELSDNWRPIESAPTGDGKHIIGYCYRTFNESRIAVLEWLDGKWCWDFSDAEPTHWMPLPSPPREKEQEVE